MELERLDRKSLVHRDIINIIINIYGSGAMKCYVKSWVEKPDSMLKLREVTDVS